MITILTLTYNGRHDSLKRTIDSVYEHTDTPFEYIVVDNDSNITAKKLLDEYQNDKKVKWIELKTNEGVCARNYGIEEAKGEIIVQIDDDVTVHKGWTDILMNFVDPEIGCIGPDGSWFDGWKGNNMFNKRGIKPGDFCDFITGFFMCFRNCGVRYDNVNFKFFWREESDLNIQIKQKGYRCKMTPMVVDHHSLRNGIDRTLLDANTKNLEKKWKDVPIQWERFKQ